MNSRVSVELFPLIYYLNFFMAQHNPGSGREIIPTKRCNELEIILLSEVRERQKSSYDNTYM